MLQDVATNTIMQKVGSGMALLMGVMTHRRMRFDTSPDSIFLLERIVSMSAEDSYYNVDSYEILQVIPVSGYSAVFSQPHPTEEGKLLLEPEPIHFLGLVKVTVESFVRRSGFKSSISLGSECIGNRLLGLTLCGGFFDVCDEASNFAGLIRDGDDIQSLE